MPTARQPEACDNSCPRGRCGAAIDSIALRLYSVGHRYPADQASMSIKGKAYVMGAFEHPTREAKDRSTPQLHADCMRGALEDAGLKKDDIDGYFCAGDAPGFGAMSMADYLGLRNLRHMDSTETGGSSYILHVGHAAEAIAAGKCSVALITLAGKPLTENRGPGGGGGGGGPPRGFGTAPEAAFEMPYGGTTHNQYAMCATRHMHEF